MKPKRKPQSPRRRPAARGKLARRRVDDVPADRVPRDGARVEPRRVYVIPPGKDMSLLHGTLQLLPQAVSRSRVLPIDFFFRSLAQDQGERSMGVILSGMGTDGFVVVDHDPVVVAINPVAEAMPRCPAADALGRPLGDAAALRDLADRLAPPATGSELVLGGARYAVRVERDQRGDYLVFLSAA